ncbi:undecaprenyl-phosphate glucose phosphotransferase [Lyngbya confervoides]|uniref:Undecaprenyl-phosphate glucose phosphotransferase n=1 Tax=Lyngbya confervoides BDU141951 TaxID=1574623 RepID=A0ABD4T3P7_9CYAN|nr:undecaprenyl-phosphate glucose phosphotransferase [Lyngbya confervoides]MCM1983281.1 undecaprenyl-phosphate glucose phosphotransferase [Lyngbya confervoides BDU141951]
MPQRKKKSVFQVIKLSARRIWGFQRILDALVATGLLLLCTVYFEARINQAYLILAGLTLLLTPPLMKLVGVYDALNTDRPQTRFPQILMGWTLVATLLMFLGFFTQTSIVFSRQLIFTWLLMTPIALGVNHQFIHYLLRHLQASGHYSRKAVIAGTGNLSAMLAGQLRSSPELGLELCGFFSDTRFPNQPTPAEFKPALGTLEELPIYVRRYRVDVVYLTLPLHQESQVSKLLRDLQDTTACVYFVPNITMFTLMQAKTYDINGIPLISVWEIPFSDLQYFLKRIFDILIATAALIILSPLMVAIAVAVKITSPGPILFKQKRYGISGQEIKVYKFRSMTVLENDSEVKQATKDDRRITPVGRFLRKTSLDELPQFFNVLQGRMSIVGPRPHAVAHNEYYRQRIQGYMLRHLVKPGITGLAQVNGYRGETETLDKMQARIDYDLKYLRQWSLWLDMVIIFKTVLVVLKRQNAY